MNRNFDLDLLRGIAIALVIGVHVPEPGYPIWSRSGWIGVDLFFVLSGFLISNLLFSEYRATGDIRLGRFFVRRALKLYPSFYLMLAASLAALSAYHAVFSGRQVIGEMLMVQNYLGGLWGHTWSLAVEEHFYLYLPLALAAMLYLHPRLYAPCSGEIIKPRAPFGAVPYLFGVIAATCLLARVAHAPAVYDHRSTYEFSHLRFDSLFAGVLIGYLHNFRPELLTKLMRRPYRFPLAIASVACLAPALIFDGANPLVFTLGFSLLYVAFAIVLLLVLYPEAPAAAPARAPGFFAWSLARIGVYSYTIYLWHVPIAALFVTIAYRFPTVNPYTWHLLYFTASIAIGVTLSKLVEMPVLRLRDRLTAAPAPAAVRIAA